MKATGSKLIKVARIKELDIYQDTDTKKLFVDVFGALREVASMEDAAKYIDFFSSMSEMDKQGFGID